MNASGKNGYVREAWAGSANLAEVKRYVGAAIANAVPDFYKAVESDDYDAMCKAANDLRRVSTRLLSFARMKQRQKRKQEAPENASRVGV